MTLTQLCYIVMVGIAWTWAASQIGYALDCKRYWPIPWRLTSAVWLTCKATFLTYVGVVAWPILDDHTPVILLFTAAHLFAFGHWWTLPHSEDTTIEPPTPRGR